MLLINHNAGHVLKFVQLVGQFCKHLLQKHKTVLFTRVNVTALVVGTEKNCLNESVLLSTQNICLNLWLRTFLQFYAENICLSKPVL